MKPDAEKHEEDVQRIYGSILFGLVDEYKEAMCFTLHNVCLLIIQYQVMTLFVRHKRSVVCFRTNALILIEPSPPFHLVIIRLSLLWRGLIG